MKTLAHVTMFMLETMADAFVVCGTCAITIGAWLLSPALGLIVFGVIVTVVGIGISRTGNDS